MGAWLPTRCIGSQNSAWRRNFRQEKGPGDYPGRSIWWWKVDYVADWPPELMSAGEGCCGFEGVDSTIWPQEGRQATRQPRPAWLFCRKARSWDSCRQQRQSMTPVAPATHPPNAWRAILPELREGNRPRRISDPLRIAEVKSIL